MSYNYIPNKNYISDLSTVTYDDVLVQMKSPKKNNKFCLEITA